MSRRTGAPRLAALVSWLVLGASFGLSAATWIALARLAGLTGHLPLGADLAWLMPVAIDGYVVVALLLWMAPVPATVARFARTNTYAAASLGVAAQSAYHGLTILAETHVVWRAVLAAVVGAAPPAVAALAVHMRALLVRETATATQAATVADVAVTATDDEWRDPWDLAVPVMAVAPPSAVAVAVPPTTPPPPAQSVEAPVSPAPPPVAVMPRHRHRPATPASSDARDIVAAAWRDNPTATARQIHTATGVSLRTVERHLPAIRRGGGGTATRSATAS